MPTTSSALQSMTTNSRLPISSTPGSIPVGDGSGSGGGGGEAKPPIALPYCHLGQASAKDDRGDHPTDQPSNGPSSSVPSTTGSIMSSSFTTPMSAPTTSRSTATSSTSLFSASACGAATLNLDFLFVIRPIPPILFLFLGFYSLFISSYIFLS